VPALYIILEDMKWLSARAFTRSPVPAAAPQPARQHPRPREALPPSAEQPASPLH